MNTATQTELEGLLSDAKQTAVFLDRNSKDHPDMDILWQASNMIRALVKVIESA